MRYLAVSCVCLLTILPCVGISQTIPVQAGEHGDFTRLVIRIPEQSSWRIDTAIGRVDIIFDGFNGQLDFRSVFDRIPRTRVSEIEEIPAGVSLQLECACDVTSFIADDRFLAIDILEGPPLSPNVLEEMRRAQQPANIPQSQFIFGDLLWANETTDGQAPLAATSPDAEPSGAQPDSPNTIEDAFLAEARERLRFGVMAAASRGILKPESTLPLPLEPDPPATTPSDLEQIAPIDGQMERSIPGYVNLRITTSSDRGEPAFSQPELSESINCLSRPELNISDWADLNKGINQIGELRANLYNELDQPSKDTVSRLAKALLYFGMGPEAKQILALEVDVESRYPELLDIADIMEFGYARNPRIVHSGLNCPDESAMWSVMSAKSIPEDQAVNTEAVLRTLSSLPFHLRKNFAPIVANRLLDIGEADSAGAALRTVERFSEDVNAQTDIASANLSIERGHADRGTETLQALIDRGDASSPEAIIALVNEKVRDGSSVTPDLALLIESYAHELSMGEYGDQLTQAQIISLSKSQQHAKSFELLGQHGDNSFIKRNLEKIQEVLIKELSSNSSDVTFLVVLLGNLNEISKDVNPTALISAAERALALGFPDISQRLLSINEASRLNQDGMLLGSKVSIEMGELANALEDLRGINGAEADRIRAVANEALGQNSEASILFNSLGDVDGARRNAWLSESWIDLIDDQDPIFGASSAVSKMQLPSTVRQDSMLENISTLLADSTSSRKELSNLLQSIDLNN